jgi:hypothetical protein
LDLQPLFWPLKQHGISQLEAIPGCIFEALYKGVFENIKEVKQNSVMLTKKTLT